MKDIYAETFSLTQGGRSTTVWVHRTPDTITGFWKSAQPNFDFRDSGHGNQFAWNPWGSHLSLYNDIGLVDTVGQGHAIDFSSADTSLLALIILGVNIRHLKVGDQGTGGLFFNHGHVLNPGSVTWEYQGRQLVRDWQIGPNE